MCSSLAELLILERGFVCLCVCDFYTRFYVAAGSWQDVALMKGSFKDLISVYSPDDEFLKSFAKIQTCLLM